MTKKHRISLVHRIAGVMALMTLLIFWFSTVISELTGNIDYIRNVKDYIPYGFIILIPSLMIVGGTGFKIANKVNNPILSSKKKRMLFIALNGLLILVPCAYYLRFLAMYDQFGLSFIMIQIVELIAGGINIAMMMLNVRAGIILARNNKVIR